MRIIPTRMWCGWGGLLYGILLLYLYSGVPLLHSRDLVHWELINHCVKKLPFEKYALPCHGSGTWAPSIRYHEGTFFVFILWWTRESWWPDPRIPTGNLNGICCVNQRDGLTPALSGMMTARLTWFCLCKEPLRYKTPAVAGGNRFPVPIPSDRAQAYI